MKNHKSVGYAVRLGERIVIARANRGYTQNHLAFRAEMHGANLSRIENGLVDPTLSTLLKIASALDLELCRLLPRSEQ